MATRSPWLIQYPVLSTQMCWKNPNLNHFAIKWSKKSASNRAVLVLWSPMIKIKKRFQLEVTLKQLLGTRYSLSGKIWTGSHQHYSFRIQFVSAPGRGRGINVISLWNDILTMPKRTIMSSSQQELPVVSNWLKVPRFSLAHFHSNFPHCFPLLASTRVRFENSSLKTVKAFIKDGFRNIIVVFSAYSMKTFLSLLFFWWRT